MRFQSEMTKYFKMSAGSTSALHAAAKEGRVSEVETLVNFSGDPNKVNSQGKTPLHVAIENGRNEICQFLVGITDLTIQDHGGWTVLHWAANMGSEELVKIILDADSEVIRSCDYNWRTPLHLAAIRGKADVVKAFVHAKADLEAIDDDGKTALNLALLDENWEAVRILEEAMSVDSAIDVDQT